MNSYNKRLQGKSFKVDNYQKWLGLTKKEVLSLTGIYGYKYSRAKRAPKLIIFGEYPRLTVIAEKNGISLMRTINIKTKEISNSRFELVFQRRKFGTKVFRAQVRAASLLGFKLITCRAHGSFSQPENGYITWGKLGYSMSDLEEISSFLNELKGNGLPIISSTSIGSPISLFETLQTPLGEDHWHKKGWSWNAEFKTNLLTPNQDWLNIYLTKNGLDTL